MTQQSVGKGDGRGGGGGSGRGGYNVRFLCTALFRQPSEIPTEEVSLYVLLPIRAGIFIVGDACRKQPTKN